MGFSDWTETLAILRRIIQRFNPDLILTSWSDTWLLPLLLEKAQEYHIDLNINRETGRNVKMIPERTYFSYGQIVHRGSRSTFMAGSTWIKRTPHALEGLRAGRHPGSLPGDRPPPPNLFPGFPGHRHFCD